MRAVSHIVWTGICAASGVVAVVSAEAQETAERPTQLSPWLVDSLAPFLATWLVSSREAAVSQGVEPMPPPMRSALAEYVPEDVLRRVRWREGASELSLPQNAIRFGHVDAMTLGDVIVFHDRNAALEDPKLWAHELKHVMQFDEWGVDGFAARYLRDYEAVEAEAIEFRWEFMKQAGLIPPVPPPAE